MWQVPMAYESMNEKMLYEMREKSEMDETSKRKGSDESEKHQRSGRRGGPTVSDYNENSTYESGENGEIRESS